MTSQQVVARARALVGTRFRPQGRDPGQGLDCIGVVIAAFGLDPRTIPDDYRISSPAREGEWMNRVLAHFSPCRGSAPGQLVVMRIGPRQLHLAVQTERGIVHADIRRRQVLEGPIPPGATIVGVFRRRRPTHSRKTS